MASSSDDVVPTRRMIRRGSIAAKDQWVELRTTHGVPYWHNVKTNALSATIPAVLKTRELVGASEWAWLQDEKDAYLPVHKTKKEGSNWHVQLESGETRIVDKNSLIDMPIGISDVVPDDLVALEDVSEPSLLHSLRRRLQKDRSIYTSVGNTLITLNPHSTVPLYGPNQIDKYRTSYVDQRLEPHIFGVVRQALHDLMFAETPKSQAIIMRGVSGSGKTFNTRQALNYILETLGGGGSDGLEDFLITGEGLLESFGNASIGSATASAEVIAGHENSSRLGRVFDMHFNVKNKICGARVRTYALEKSRVTGGDGTNASMYGRNFHIFYELLSGATDVQKQTYSLQGGVKAFKCLNAAYDVSVRSKGNASSSSSSSSSGDDAYVRDDIKGFTSTMKALAKLGFNASHVDVIMRMLSAILHIGNLTFTPRKANDPQGDAECKDKEVLDTIAELLAIDVKSLTKSIVSQTYQASKKSSFLVQVSMTQVAEHRDNLMRHMYHAVVNTVVNAINSALAGAGIVTPRTLLLVDFPGIESVALPTPSASTKNAKSVGGGSFVNGLDTLLINYADERLHQQYIQTSFTRELALYEQEGVTFREFTYANNDTVVDTLDAEEKGVLPLIDAEYKVPKCTDASYLSSLQSAQQDNTVLSFSSETSGSDAESKSNATRFTVNHFCGSVNYTADAFLARNKDTLPQNLVSLLQSSSIPMISHMVSATTLGFDIHTLDTGLSSPGAPLRTLSGTVADLASENASSSSSSSGNNSSSSSSSSSSGNSSPTASSSSSSSSVSGDRLSLTTKLIRQLDDLETQLENVTCRYVLHFLPNPTRAPFFVDGHFLLNQLRAFNVLELVDIRKRGFPIRMTHDDFAGRYMYALTREKRPLKRLVGRDQSQHLVQGLGLVNQCLVGRSLVLYKQDQHLTLELYRSIAVEQKVLMSQTWFRAVMTFKRFRRVRELSKRIGIVLSDVEICIGRDDVPGLRNQLDLLNKLKAEIATVVYPTPKPIPAFAACSDAINRVIRALKVHDVLAEVLKPEKSAREVYSLAFEALAEAELINMRTAATEAAAAKIASFKEIRECERQLQDGMQLGDAEMIKQALETATKGKLDIPSIGNARHVLREIETEMALIRSLEPELVHGIWRGEIDANGNICVKLPQKKSSASSSSSSSSSAGEGEGDEEDAPPVTYVKAKVYDKKLFPTWEVMEKLYEQLSKYTLRTDKGKFLYALSEQLKQLRPAFQKALAASAEYASSSAPSTGEDRRRSQKETKKRPVKQCQEEEDLAWREFGILLDNLVNTASSVALQIASTSANPFATVESGSTTPSTITNASSNSSSSSSSSSTEERKKPGRRMSISKLDLKLAAAAQAGTTPLSPSTESKGNDSSSSTSPSNEQALASANALASKYPEVVANPEVQTMIKALKYKRTELKWRVTTVDATEGARVGALEKLVKAGDELKLSETDDSVLLAAKKVLADLKSIIAEAEKAMHATISAQVADGSDDSHEQMLNSVIKRANDYGGLHDVPQIESVYEAYAHLQKEKELVDVLARAIAVGAWVNDCPLGDYDNYRSATHINYKSLQAAAEACEAHGMKSAGGRRTVALGYITAELRRALIPAVKTQDAGLWAKVRELLFDHPLSNLLSSMRVVEFDSAAREVKYQQAIADAVVRLKAAMTSRDDEEIKTSLQVLEGELNAKVATTPIIKDARDLHSRIVKCKALVEEALTTASTHLLEEAISMADGLGLNTERVEQCRVFLRVTRELATATEKFSESHMAEAVTRANFRGLPASSLALAQATSTLKAVTACKQRAKKALDAYALATAAGARGVSEALNEELRNIVLTADSLGGLNNLDEILRVRKAVDQYLQEGRIVTIMRDATEQGGWLNPQVASGNYDEYQDPLSIELDLLVNVIEECKELGLCSVQGRQLYGLCTLLLPLRRAMVPAVTKLLDETAWNEVERVLDTTPGIRAYTHTSNPHPELVAARKEVDYFKTVKECLARLAEDVQRRDITKLKDSTAKCAANNLLAKFHPTVGEANELLQALIAADDSLVAAVSSMSQRAMATAIEEANDLNLVNKNYERCKLVLAAVIELKAAIKERLESRLQAALEAIFALNVNPSKLAAQAAGLLRQLSACRVRAHEVWSHAKFSSENRGVDAQQIVDMRNVAATAQSLGGMQSSQEVVSIVEMLRSIFAEEKVLANLVTCTKTGGLDLDPLLTQRGDYDHYPLPSSIDVIKLRAAIDGMSETSCLLSDSRDYLWFARAVLDIRNKVKLAIGTADNLMWLAVEEQLLIAEQGPANLDHSKAHNQERLIRLHDFLQYLPELKAVRSEIEYQKKVYAHEAVLLAAIESCDIKAMDEAIATAQIHPLFMQPKHHPDSLHACILRRDEVKQAHLALTAAIDAVDEQKIISAIQGAEAVKYPHDDLNKARNLLISIQELTKDATRAFNDQDEKAMLDCVSRANVVKLRSPLLTSIAHALHVAQLDPIEFLKVKRNVALANRDASLLNSCDHQIAKQLLRKGTTAREVEFESCSIVKSPAEWASEKFFSWDRQALANGMFKYSDESIHASLTTLEESTFADVSMREEPAIMLFDLLLEFAKSEGTVGESGNNIDDEDEDDEDTTSTDKRRPFISSASRNRNAFQHIGDVGALKRVIAHVQQRQWLINEFFVQLMKQLSGVPATLRDKYWVALGVALQFFTPRGSDFQRSVQEFLMRRKAELYEGLLLDRVYPLAVSKREIANYAEAQAKERGREEIVEKARRSSLSRRMSASMMVPQVLEINPMGTNSSSSSTGDDQNKADGEEEKALQRLIEDAEEEEQAFERGLSGVDEAIGNLELPQSSVSERKSNMDRNVSRLRCMFTPSFE